MNMPAGYSELPWNDVIEHLPPDNTPVLVIYEDGSEEVITYHNKELGFVYYMGDYIEDAETEEKVKYWLTINPDD